jgi:hypothetical protein
VPFGHGRIAEPFFKSFSVASISSFGAKVPAGSLNDTLYQPGHEHR